METSGLSKFNRVLKVLPKSNSAGDTPVVAFGAVQYHHYDKRNLISLVGKVPESPLAALITCLNV